MYSLGLLGVVGFGCFLYMSGLALYTPVYWGHPGFILFVLNIQPALYLSKKKKKEQLLTKVRKQPLYKTKHKINP